MSNLSLEVNIISANNLVNVNFTTQMEVYGVITIQGDDTLTKQKVRTPVDRSGGSNPTWNHAVKFSVDEELARDGSLTLTIRLKSRRFLGNKEIGGVIVPLLELLKSSKLSINGDVQEMTSVKYPVVSPSEKRKGYLNFAYRFNKTLTESEMLAVLNRSVVSSCPPQKHLITGGSSSDPLPISYGAGLSPYDQTGYAHHHAPPEARQKGYEPSGSTSPSPPKETGLGLGLGLGAGILGGLIIGDIVSEVSNCYDM